MSLLSLFFFDFPFLFFIILRSWDEEGRRKWVFGSWDCEMKKEEGSGFLEARTRVSKTQVPCGHTKVKFLRLELLQWNRDVSLLNSLKTLLTNEIVCNLVLFSNFFPTARSQPLSTEIATQPTLKWCTMRVWCFRFVGLCFLSWD